jgi:eukaryotic-like serine/threonine-protein kinase
MKDLLEFLKTKLFWKHFVAAVLIVFLIVWGTMQVLSNYTKHGHTVKVPDIRGKSLEEIDQILESQNLRYVITDSIFDSKKKKGAVLDQDPEPGMEVKENRTLYLTTNSYVPPQVKMPNLVDVSLRQAVALLETYGLEPGKLSYVPDFAKNAVIKQLYKGKLIKPGDPIRKGSKIDLVLGDGLSDEKVDLPSVIGKSYSEAVDEITSAGLNLGAVISDETVKDSLRSYVYKQNPPASSGTINKGNSVDLFITQDKSKLTPSDTLD